MSKEISYGSSSTFFAIEKSDLAPTAMIAQCLDNQWAPTSTLRTVQRLRTTPTLDQIKARLRVWRDGLTNADLNSYRRAEYVRSLIAAEQVVVNRVFFVNTKIIYQDYLPAAGHRAAFISLINSGAIIPFFFNDENPLDVLDAEFSTAAEGRNAWRDLCREAQPRCIRLSWNNEDNNNEIAELLTRPFHDRVRTLDSGDPERFLKHLRGLDAEISADEARDFQAHLQLVTEHVNRTMQEKGRHAKRDDMYSRFVTLPNTDTAHLRYDGTKRFMVETKQLVDLVYNTNLSDALQVLTLTPSDSPTRLALQELSRRPTVKAVSPEQLSNVLRDVKFALVQRSLDFIDFGALSMSDVAAIRATAEWRQYNAALAAVVTNTSLLNSIEEFMNPERGMLALEQAFEALIRIVSKHWSHARASRANVKLGIKMTVEVGANYLIALWAGGLSPMIQTGMRIGVRRAAEEAAEVITSVSIGWLQERSTDLINSVNVQLSRRRFSNARRDMEALVEQLLNPTSGFSKFRDANPDEIGATVNQEIQGE